VNWTFEGHSTTQAPRPPHPPCAPTTGHSTADCIGAAMHWRSELVRECLLMLERQGEAQERRLVRRGRGGHRNDASSETCSLTASCIRTKARTSQICSLSHTAVDTYTQAFQTSSLQPSPPTPPPSRTHILRHTLMHTFMHTHIQETRETSQTCSLRPSRSQSASD
jgi:hypothetical protein